MKRQCGKNTYHNMSKKDLKNIKKTIAKLKN